jgi:DNA-binding SARP family transcriptional activator/TolB-like protein
MGVSRLSDTRQTSNRIENTMLEFRALGTIHVGVLSTDQSLSALIARPKLLALFTHLVLSNPPRFRQRDTLLAVFWPEHDQQQGRHALRQALYELRGLLGKNIVVSRGDELGINPELLRCDVHAFETAIEAHDYAAALELYRGDLLPGFYISGCPEFEHWIDGLRRRLRALAVLAVRERTRELRAGEDFSGSIPHLRRGLVLDPYDEGLLRELLHCLQQLGDRSRAIREYEAFRSRLFRDLALDPSGETEALVDAIRRAGSGVPGGSPPPLSALPDPYTEPETQRSARRRSWSLTPERAAALAGFVALLAIIGIVVDRDHATDSTAIDLEPDRVLVLPFTNRTGDPELDRLGHIAGDWIVRGLAETDLVRTVSTPSLRPDEKDELGNTVKAARVLAERNRAALAIIGSYYLQEDSLAFEAQLIDAATGELLRAISRIRTPTEAPLGALHELREKATGSVASVVDPRLRSWAGMASQPPSYAAYLLYDQGLEALFGLRRDPFSLAGGARGFKSRAREAADYFSRAAALDSSFNIALLWAAHVHLYARERARSDSLSQVLNEKREQLTQWERALLDGLRARIRGDLPAAYRAYSRTVAMTPGGVWNYNLAEIAYQLNRPGEASRLLSVAGSDRETLIQWEMYWNLLTIARHRLGDHEQELRDARAGRRKLPGSARLRSAEIRALGALGRVGDLSPRDHNEAFLFVEELLRHGHEAAAGELIGDYLTRYDPSQDSLHLNNAMYWLEKAGRADESEVILQGLVEENPDNAWAWRRLGEIAAKRGARQEALDISLRLGDRRVPSDERGRVTYYRAVIAAHLGDNELATQLIRQAWNEGWQPDRYRLHITPYLPQSLRDYPPFQELMQPED